ncbi:hypothetical protein OfM1_04210 [Lactovum odontotermitis]
MPGYYFEYGIKIIVKYNEYNHIGAPHVHVELAGEDIASVSLEGELLAGNISRRSILNYVRRIIEQNYDLFKLEYEKGQKSDY